MSLFTILIIALVSAATITTVAVVSGNSILSAFGSVADAVLGLAMQPLTSTLNLFFALVSDVICAVLTKITNIALKLFSFLTPEAGDNVSIFDIVFHSGLENFSKAICIFSFALLLLLYIYNLSKMIIFADVREYSVIGMTLKTFFAGFLIWNGETLVVTVADFFSIVYQYFLGTASNYTVDFNHFATSVGDAFCKAFSGASQQIQSLIGCTIVIALLLIIGIELVKFVLEFTQRYVLFHTLIFSYPLALVVAPFKETEMSFAKWVRMLISEGLLLSLNVYTFRLFADAFDSYDTTIAPLTEKVGGGIGGVVLWSLLIYSILYIGVKIDSYMRTLGLSAPEIGDSLMAEAFSEFREMTMTGSLFDLGNGHRSNFSISQISTNIRAMRENRNERNVSRAVKSGSLKLETDGSTGAATRESLGLLLSQNGSVTSGRTFGLGIIQNTKRMPAKYRDWLNPTTAQLHKDGSITMQTQSMNTSGDRMLLKFVPKANYERSNGHGGRAVSIADKDYMVAAISRNSSLESAFYSYNPTLQRTLEREGYDASNIKEIKQGKEHTGIYTISKADKNGVTSMSVYIPLSRYPDGNMALFPYSRYEEIGGIGYQVATIPSENDESTVHNEFNGWISNISKIEHASVGVSNLQRELVGQFPSLETTDIKEFHSYVDGHRQGFTYTTSNGEVHLVQPIASSYIAKETDSNDYKAYEDKNGFVYIDKKLSAKEATDIENEIMQGSWFERAINEKTTISGYGDVDNLRLNTNNILRDSFKLSSEKKKKDKGGRS